MGHFCQEMVKKLSLKSQISEKALRDANPKKNDIDAVTLVGGMTNIPEVEEVVQDIFGKAASKVVNPEAPVGEFCNTYKIYTHIYLCT